MMKILNVAPFHLFPLQAGNQVNTYNLCRYLELCGHEVGYVFIDYGMQYEKPGDRAATWLDYTSVHGALGANFFGVAKKVINRLAKWCGRSEIDPVFLLTSKDVELIDKIIKDRGYDALIVHYAILGNLPHQIASSNLRTVIFTHDLQFIREARLKSAITGRDANVRALKTEEIELTRYQGFDQVLVVSSFEYDTLLNKGFSPSRLVLAGVSHDVKDTRGRKKEWDMLFVGSAGNWPNVQGFLWFATEILPLIRQVIPNVSCAIAGTVSETLKKENCNMNGIVSLGFVDDISDVYSRSRIVIAPLLTGSGVKVKVVEALAHAKPTITTQIGAEGLNLEVGCHYVGAETTENWVDAIVELLSCDAKLTSMENEAYEWALNNASPRAVWGGVEQRIARKGVSKQ